MKVPPIQIAYILMGRLVRHVPTRVTVIQNINHAAEVVSYITGVVESEKVSVIVK